MDGDESRAGDFRQAPGTVARRLPDEGAIVEGDAAISYAEPDAAACVALPFQMAVRAYRPRGYPGPVLMLSSRQRTAQPDPARLQRL